jgi:hypothetical protein
VNALFVAAGRQRSIHSIGIVKVERFYTRLYIDSKFHLPALVGAIARALGGRLEMSSVDTGVLSADFHTSDDYDRARVQHDPSDFLRYPFSVEVEAIASVPLDRYLDEVALMMRELQALGANVAASCDWEDLLPGGGKLGTAFPPLSE